MYKEVCLDCGKIFDVSADCKGDYCPYCGSGNTDDFHLRECECKECSAGEIDLNKYI